MDFKIGDEVRVKPEYVGKQCSHGGTFGDWTGVIISLSWDCLHIRFEERVGTWAADPKEIELVKSCSVPTENFLSPEEQLRLLQTQPPKFKTVLVLADGSRISPWAAGGTGYAGHPSLEYKEGEVTRAPEGTQGVNVNVTNREKVSLVTSKQSKFPGSYFAIHEAWAIGKRIEEAAGSGEWYPAILLGCEVWNDKPAEPPEPEWKDVSNECAYERKPGGYISVCHGGLERVLLGSKSMYLWAVVGGQCPGKDYKIELMDRDTYPCGGFKVLKKA